MPDSLKEKNYWMPFTLALIPVSITVLGGLFVIYGDYQRQGEEIRHLNNDMRQEFLDVEYRIAEHLGQAAHGTVREDLARLFTLMGSKEARLTTLERHAGEGRRYTEEDAKDDRQTYLELIDGLQAADDRCLEKQIELADQLRAIHDRISTMESNRTNE